MGLCPCIASHVDHKLLQIKAPPQLTPKTKFSNEVDSDVQKVVSYGINPTHTHTHTHTLHREFISAKKSVVLSPRNIVAWGLSQHTQNLSVKKYDSK